MDKKETPATTQAEYDKAFEDMKSGKIQPPRNDDMGPVNTGDEMTKGSATEKELLKYLRAPARQGMKKGGSVKKMAKGGSVSSASKRADGCATKGKTKGRMI